MQKWCVDKNSELAKYKYAVYPVGNLKRAFCETKGAHTLRDAEKLGKKFFGEGMYRIAECVIHVERKYCPC